MPKRILIQYSMPCLPMQYGDSWEEKNAAVNCMGLQLTAAHISFYQAGVLRPSSPEGPF